MLIIGILQINRIKIGVGGMYKISSMKKDKSIKEMLAYLWADLYIVARKPDFVACKQQRCRPACASALESMIAKPATCRILLQLNRLA